MILSDLFPKLFQSKVNVFGIEVQIRLILARERYLA